MTNSNEESKIESKESEHRCRHGRKFWKVPFIVAAIILIKSGLVLLVWNQLMPDLFHLPTLSYLQAIELTVLAKLLVGFGGHRLHHRHGHHRWHSKWAKLSPEEREKMREAIRGRCQS